ncbi:hypothetical protein LQ938_01160 [Microbacterium sp. cx-55]|uniref:hypothetical protein n=1 Tax=Microbacterium sp. cx-55 TaxID=2875948 RepID=UPI001CBC4910|nr:hypothetical protein [Microbacterium sp. cx-55]MBZ4487416.1 hypothetical protein [Microbacterium sp. cx-55]UGB35436.1 hypothetical protein LQ938_01160 [Microbacterium sp. cx-55]
MDKTGALDQLQEAMRTMDVAQFTSLHVLDRLPHVFASREQYTAWRTVLGRGLGVDPLCIVVVGSGAVGFSLSPREEKRFRAFHGESDIDVAIISPTHFEEAWRNIRAMRGETARELRGHWRHHRSSLVFDGTIATDTVLAHLSFGPQWASALGRVARVHPTMDRDVKARIYRDFDSLRDYQRRGVEKLRGELLDDQNQGPTGINEVNEND